MKPQISGIVLVKNEEKALPRALASLLWCDEILVIDAGSTDASVELVLDPKAPWANKVRLIKNPWPGFSAQRNFALSQTSSSWRFFLDADEACSAELALELRSIAARVSTDDSTSYYHVRRREYFLSREIKHGSWNPSYHPRFLREGSGQYVKVLHEDFEGRGSPGRIEAPIDHWLERTIEDISERVNRYTTLEASRDFEKGTRTNLLQATLVFPAMFLKTYFYFGGFKDGRYGFAISLLEGIARVIRCLKLWQIQEQRKVPGMPLWQLWRGHPREN